MDSYKLKTKLQVEIEWEKEKGNKKERERFEKQIREIADFVNEDLGVVIQTALEV